MATELTPAPASTCTLYELEDNLEAFANTIDLAEDEPTRRLILDEIGQALRRAKEKRDGIAAFLRHCETQQRFADLEIERIQKKKVRIAQVQAELERYVVQVVEQFAVPDRRGVKRLEGNLSSLRIQKNPDSVLITDLDAVPLAFKQAVLVMPAHVWEALFQRLSLEDRKVFEPRVEKLEFKPDKKAIAAELKNGVPIAGADLKVQSIGLIHTGGLRHIGEGSIPVVVIQHRRCATVNRGPAAGANIGAERAGALAGRSEISVAADIKI